MDTSVVVAIAGIIIATVVTLFVASRQGVFRRRGKLFVTIGTPQHVENNRKPIWLVLVGIPDMDAKYYVVCLPYLFENRGEERLKNVWVQLSYPRRRDPTVVETILGVVLQDDSVQISRRVLPVDDYFFVEYDIPLLRPGEKLIIHDPIVYKRSELSAKSNGQEKATMSSNDNASGSRAIDQIECHILAENCKPMKHKVWLVACSSQDIDALIPELDGFVKELLLRESPRKIRLATAIRSRLFKSTYFQRRVLLMQPAFFAADDQVVIQRPAEVTYQTANMDVYLARLW